VRKTLGRLTAGIGFVLALSASLVGNDQWTGWVLVPGDGRTPSAPAATVVNGELALFVRGSDDRLYVNWLQTNDQWTGWVLVPGDGRTPSAPAATVLDDELALFVRGSDDRVYVNWLRITGGAIRCETGVVNITKPDGEDFVIDGRGRDCIRVEGNCSVRIDPKNISLINCARCVDAGGGAQVTLITPDGDIRCDAHVDGIRARGNASVTLDARGSPSRGGNIIIDSTGDHGIRVEGTAEVTLSAQREITIAGGEDAGIRAEGTAAVELNAARCTIVGAEEALDVSGNAIVETRGCGELQLIGETP
jgi:hypothetical protein